MNSFQQTAFHPRNHRNAGIGIALLAASAWLMTGTSSRLDAAEPRELIVAEDVSHVHTLDQNWTDDESRWFYSVPQGSKLIPYRWFLHLEVPDGETLFRDSEHIRSLGYLPRGAGPDNPDGLPIGFTQDGNFLGLNCAACHTNQINFQGQAWLVDGAPTLGDFETFLRELVDALDQTANDPEKFDRFAAQVLPDGASPAQRNTLQEELRAVLDFRRGYNARNLPRSGDPAFGPGRVDAFGAIMNEITTTFAQVPSNDLPANAPVSYPFLWDTPQHDRVQWNGAAENTVVLLARPLIGTAHVGALGRNSGEVLGVFGGVDASEEGSLLQLRGYPSTVNRPNLAEIEELLTKLWSPQWPDEFPPIDETLRAKGEILFDKHCQSCHLPIRRTDPDRVVVAQMDAVGTDPMMASNFASRTARTGILEGRRLSLLSLKRLRPRESYENMLTHMVERVILRRPLEPELTGMESLADAAPNLFNEPGSDPMPQSSPADNEDAGPELTPEEAENAIRILAQGSPDFRIFADIKVGDKTLSGGFKEMDFSEGLVRQAVSPEGLRLMEDKKLYQLDAESFGAAPQFVAPDGTNVELESLPGVSHEFSPAGTRLTFAEPATPSFAYKGRPLNGIWATAPYLHNGSVPTLDELLKPADQRVERFKVGSRELDPVKVGFKNEGNFEFDTTLPANSNAGHEYGEKIFTEEERLQLIEYLKSL